MADKIFFKTGLASSLPTTKTAGQLLFAIDGTTGSIYLDKDSKTRIKFNADTIKLATPRSINGTSFDGSSDITTANWGTARNFAIKDADSTNAGTAVSVNGSGAVTLLLPSTIKANITGKATSAGTADIATTAITATTTTGNAGTATKLQTARTINGTSFDGTGNITTANWGTSRNITIKDGSGNKGTAVAVNGSTNVELILPTTIAATVSAADKLTVNAGDSNTPVYFEGGVPKAVTSIDVKSDKAAKLDPGAKINGTTFTGASDITTANWGTARNFTVGNTTKSVNGSAAMSWSLSEIGAVAKAGDTMTGYLTGKVTNASWIGITRNGAFRTETAASSSGAAAVVSMKTASGSWAIGNLTGSNNLYFVFGTDENYNTITNATSNYYISTNGAFSGSAATLTTARSINGTSFDGSADITTSKWGTARTLTIGNTGKSVNGSSNVSWSLAEIGAVPKIEGSTHGTYTVYRALGNIYKGGTAVSYYRIALPQATSWGMFMMKLAVRESYASGSAGEIIIYANHSSSADWNQFFATCIGDLSTNIKVYGSDKKYFYIGGSFSYGGLSIELMTVGDSASAINLSNVVIDTVTALPSTYQTATMCYSLHSNNYTTHLDSRYVTLATEQTITAAKTLTSNWSFKTTNYTSTPIQLLDDSTTYGHTMLIGAGGTTYIGAGESASTLYSKLAVKSTEDLILGADSSIRFHTGADSATTTSGITLNTSNQLYPQTNNAGSLGTSSYKWGSIYSNKGYFGGTWTTDYALNTASFICDSWIRTKGDTGWYNETYSGGWYMSDTTYIRAYNSKKVYVSNDSMNAIYTAGAMCAVKGFTIDETMTVSPSNQNELNFGGSNNSSTIYFGYKALDSKPIPTKFIFGGSTGTADLQAKTVYLGSGTSSYVSSSQYTGNAATATAFSTNRTIALTGDVTGSASTNGSSGWSISTTVADDSHNHSYLTGWSDTRNVTTTPNDYNRALKVVGIKTATGSGTLDGSEYSTLVGIRGWSDSSGGNSHELAFTGNGGLYRRHGATTAWNSWLNILDSGNYTTYTVTKTGSGASGTWGISITGSADKIISDKKHMVSSAYSSGKGHRLYLRQYVNTSSSSTSSTDCNYFETYNLPTPTPQNRGNRNYNILTSKMNVTVSQGGTGSSTAGASSGQALYNLGLVYSATEPASPTTGMVWLKPA